MATLVRADWLILLTDVDGLYTANPATDPTAQPIYEGADLSQLNVRRPPLMPVYGDNARFVGCCSRGREKTA